jgi:hypothetical protein
VRHSCMLSIEVECLTDSFFLLTISISLI